MADKFKKIEDLFKSDEWKNRHLSLKMLKEEIYGPKEKEDYAKEWALIKEGLLNEDGRVRNAAFYALGGLRCRVIMSDNSLLDLEMLRDLDGMVRTEQNDKIKKNLYRCVIEMRSIALEFKAKHAGMLEDYLSITNEAIKATGRKTNYNKGGKFHEKLEELGRNLFTMIELEEEATKRMMDKYVPLNQLVLERKNHPICIDGTEEKFGFILAPTELVLFNFFIANSDTTDADVLKALRRVKENPLHGFGTDDEDALEFAITFGLSQGLQQRKLSIDEIKAILDWLIKEVEGHSDGKQGYLEFLEDFFKEYKNK